MGRNFLPTYPLFLFCLLAFVESSDLRKPVSFRPPGSLSISSVPRRWEFAPLKQRSEQLQA